MSFAVRILGPDFLEAENRKAFLRIEESVRQYSAHSRESIYIIRNPIEMVGDHFVLLWSHGSAVVELLPYGGGIRGSRVGDWTVEENQVHSVSEYSFANAYVTAIHARDETITLLKQLVSTKRAKRPILQPEFTNDGPPESSAIVSEDIALGAIKAIALFTLPVRGLAIDDSLRDRNFSAMSLEYATSRTVYHLPNLLRLTDQQSVVFTPEELEATSSELERLAIKRESATKRSGEILPVIRLKKAVKSAGSFRWWWIPVILIPIIILYMVIRPASHLSEQQSVDSTTTAKRVQPVTNLVLVLPQEVQLYISPNVYKTRHDLDLALSHGEGERILPTSPTLVISLDSVAFAKGVYGYFRADNAWRKGKLLQSFHSNDTIAIDNFLPPLQ